MKVVKKSGLSQGAKQSFTLRLRKETLQELDRIGNENEVSRQRLVEAILEQVLADKKFVLELETD